MLQSASWNSFKHNTLNVFIAYALNGAIFYILLAYGSASDPILTKHCGFLNKLDKMGCLYNGRYIEGLSSECFELDQTFCVLYSVFSLFNKFILLKCSFRHLMPILYIS